MRQDMQFGLVMLLLHDDDGDLLIPLDNIAAAAIVGKETRVWLKAPVGAAAIIVHETPAEIQSRITETIKSMIQSVMGSYT